ncbi:hypothetical protein JHE06_11535 [Carnobacterium sp. CS13]|uniref:hypothetical protein n=1 Tax=Carnobacterium sp. CS13 TaxID=2800128 RepID=UPI001913B020|nr:hypothetical protein [Carnobacterium sp. CS13]QQP70187.1 hypothetical protein JHE06_11535 [Carnobacterium sp. CS13]
MDTLKDDDSEKIKEIIERLNRYDKLEFLQRVSALRLCFENRDKAVLIDAITTEMLRWLFKNNWNYNGLSMSYGKFKKVINLVNQLSSKNAIDPLDNPYVDEIQFYGNYKVLPGINESSSYNLKILIDTLFRNGIPDEKQQIIVDTISFHLSISTLICSKLNFAKELKFEREIFIPSKEVLDEYIGVITYEYSSTYFDDLLIDEFEFQLEHNQSFSQKKHSFLTKPFIKIDNSIILLDATSVANALCHYLSSKVVFEDVFNIVWQDIRVSLKQLGHYKVAESNLSFSLINEKNYKESIFTVANDKLLLVFGIFNGTDGNINMSKKLSERLESISTVLKKNGIEKNQIFVFVCMQTFGGNIASSTMNDSFPNLMIKPSELRVVSESEKDSLFLPRFMEAKKHRVFPNFYGDFWSLILFSKNDMSFYAGDDIDYREMLTMISIEETSDYYLDALKRNRSKIFRSLEDDNWYTGVREEFNQRYFISMPNQKKLKCFFEVKDYKTIEIITEKFNTPEQLDVLFNCFDTVSYWLEKYYSYKEIKKNILIQLELENTDIQNYFVEKELFNNSKKINLYNDKNRCVVEISADYYRAMGMSKNNYYEKELIIKVINEISILVDYKLIDELFSPKFKKKMTGVLLDDNGKLKIPTNGFKLLTISEYETNKLLDELGEFLKDQGINQGEISKELNVKFCNDIVGFLYSILEKEAKNFDKEQLMNVLVTQTETLLPIQLGEESSYNNDIILSPDEKEYFFKRLNENNQCALATKFLLEYVVATPISSTRDVGMWEIERLLAICSLIIEWAHKSDYFKYELVDTTISFLPSNRIGLIKEDFSDVNNSMLSSRNDQLEIKKTSQTNNTEYIKKIENLLMNKLNDSFRDAFAFTYEEYDSVINLMVDTFNDLDRIVWVEDKKSVIDRIYLKSDYKISKDKILSVLKFITLEEREAFLKAPKGCKGIDIFPWVFNRPLSYIRRPIINYQDKYIFGIRNILYSRKYLLHLIWQGKLKTTGKLMKDLMSKLRNLEGEAFNEKVRYNLDFYEELEVIKGVSKIGKKHISDVNNNTLGDIDIFVINRKKKKIFLVETKDFSFSRNPYEIAMEQEKMYVGDKSFVMKHLRRHLWIEENINHVLVHYNLEQGDWEIVPLFIVSEYLITKDLVENFDIEIIPFNKIAIEKFE